MIQRITYIGILTLFLILAASLVSAEKGRIYGKIYTDRGDVLEGAIRWDKNEGAWDDLIDGNKERDRKSNRSKRRKYRDKDNKVSIFGLTIYNEGGSWSGSLSQACIAFGHIKTLTPISGNDAMLLLKSGQEVEIINSSTDLGDGIRELIIETIDEGELELVWDDIEYIEFEDGGDFDSEFGERLYGTVTTSRAGEYTGWICWDVDEMFTEDILDGRDRRRKRKIEFGKIERIERISSQASMVFLKSGKKYRLDDSNDVDSGNRGIVISDLKLGRITVEWDEFESLDLKKPPADAYPNYDDFDGGRRLKGAVYDEDGEKYSGYIRWDDDEEYTWEVIDGNYRSVEFDIVLEHIKSLEKISRRTSRITLWDGRTFRLRGSNDVNDENKGILIFTNKDDDDEDAFIDWEDFDRVEFEK